MKAVIIFRNGVVAKIPCRTLEVTKDTFNTSVVRGITVTPRNLLHINMDEVVCVYREDD